VSNVFPGKSHPSGDQQTLLMPSLLLASWLLR